jgi:hypothetical protein
MIEREWSIDTQEMKDDFSKFLLSKPTTFLYCEYDDVGIRFHKAERDGNSCIQELSYGNFFMLLEAIR